MSPWPHLLQEEGISRHGFAAILTGEFHQPFGLGVVSSILFGENVDQELHFMHVVFMYIQCAWGRI